MWGVFAYSAERQPLFKKLCNSLKVDYGQYEMKSLKTFIVAHSSKKRGF